MNILESLQQTMSTPIHPLERKFSIFNGFQDINANLDDKSESKLSARYNSSNMYIFISTSIVLIKIYFDLLTQAVALVMLTSI